MKKKLAGARAEREREVAERGTKQGSGVTKISLSGERKFCHSRYANMFCTIVGVDVDEIRPTGACV